ncbi:mediator of RNA polymerase II transcription subunit 1-domain-containing protein [Podospora aff. communis PSN243]|uniref:Mediator of RNA polymerase II transcription subunit 1 n=1 Tax=Podospora aff. communis PSN243 TaxID=3040156 RepID=A0AAV9GI76_9PEZI|nr:mediator of RNA polymerase II transcription subunit 1-domain-containing protein [Podospora aff. communis PSN243]
MATPNAGSAAMKQVLSQQGKTPSQSQQGAAATPPVSTPFSAAHAAFSPHGPRSSPSQVKKSPATAQSGTVVGNHPSVPANFDSPSTAAAFSALQIGVGLDLGLQGLDGLGALGRSTDDERAKRLDAVIDILSTTKGVVSEAGLERLAKKLELEVLWENGMGVDAAKKSLIVGGSALELVVVFSSPDIVESVSLNFPDSADIVKKHAGEAGKILTDNLKLAKNQSPFTKLVDSFVRNFERIANLDKLSVHPKLDLHEAVAGIFESLNRLHDWEIRQARQDPTVNARGEEYLQNHVRCVKSGHPCMNARARLGLTVDYWKEKHSVSPRNRKNLKIWSILVGCAPLRDLSVNPVRVSDKWIGPDIVKVPLPDELQTGPILDWLEPDPTFLEGDPSKEASGVDVLQAGASLLGPRLPEVTFLATFDPPIHISLSLWQQIAQSGCGLPGIDVQTLKSFDTLIFPITPGASYDPSEPRTIACTKQVMAMSNKPGQPTWYKEIHRNKLFVYKPIYGRTVTEVTFSHPQQIVNMLPYLRQYAFLSTLLERSFKEEPTPAPKPTPLPTSKHDLPKKATTTTSMDDYGEFMDGQQNGHVAAETEKPLEVDVTLTIQPVPRLQILFPFKSITADVVLEIRENGQIHIVSQNVLDETNAIAPDGRQRTVADLGGILMNFEDIGEWCEFLRTRWS